jgi:hypothetical protein
MQVLSMLATALLIGPATRAAGQTVEPFTDVPKTHWAYEAVMDLKQKGILIGYPPESTPARALNSTPKKHVPKFRPNAPKRRPQSSNRTPK